MTSPRTPGDWKWVGDLRHDSRIIVDHPQQGRTTIADVTMATEADARLLVLAPGLQDTLAELLRVTQSYLRGELVTFPVSILHQSEHILDQANGSEVTP